VLKLYHAPRTRSIRIRWLLEELQLPHELERVEFRPQKTTFAQATPFGRFPVLVDGEVVIGESGAILEYILEQYGAGRLAPGVAAPQRGEFLQWVALRGRHGFCAARRADLARHLPWRRRQNSRSDRCRSRQSAFGS